MAAIGPMTVEMRPDGSLPSVPAKLAPNPHTWLHFTDLVFIDPVQTGYSRALPGAKGEPGDPAPYFEAEADLRSIAQFIRRYLHAEQPLAVAQGHRGRELRRAARGGAVAPADGGVRHQPQPGGADLAAAEDGDAARGAALRPGEHDDDAAQPGGHRGGAPAQHAAGRPGPACPGAGRRGAVRAQRVRQRPRPPGARVAQAEADALFARVAGLTGLDPSWWRSTTAAWLRTSIVKSLLRERNQILDRYDGRLASDDPVPERAELARLDKTLTVLNGVLSAPYFDYLGRTLGYKNDRRYIMLMQKPLFNLSIRRLRVRAPSASFAALSVTIADKAFSLVPNEVIGNDLQTSPIGMPVVSTEWGAGQMLETLSQQLVLKKGRLEATGTLYCDRYWKYTTCCFCSSFVPSPEVIQTLTSFEPGCHTNVLIEEAGRV